MLITEKKTFVYGDFNTQAQRSGMRGSKITMPAVPPGYAPYAIEILREFSVSEFKGKVYQLSQSLRWEILDPGDANGAEWYKMALKRPKEVKFQMQGSGQWTVQNVRIESDDQGRYVAVALSNE